GIDNLEICAAWSRQPELGREALQIAHRRRIMVGIDDGDSVGTARGVGARRVGIAYCIRRGHELIDASERCRCLVEIPREGWPGWPGLRHRFGRGLAGSHTGVGHEHLEVRMSA